VKDVATLQRRQTPGVGAIIQPLAVYTWRVGKMKWREVYIYIHSFYIPYSHRSGGVFLQSQLSVLYGDISPVTNPEAHTNPLPSPILFMDPFTPSRNTVV
jgi:hypothetical protein